MKKLLVSALSMLAVALGFTACSSDEEIAQTPAKQVTVYASTEELAQRTALGTQGTDGTYPVFWSPNDKIKIGGKEFTLKSGDGTSTGVFEGEAPAAGTYTAYYPSTYDGTWPAAQTYVANNIPLGVPMKAENIEVDEGKISPIKFYNEGGILRLNLKGTAKVASITVCATDLNAITLNCGEGVQLDKEKATPFHIAVLGADDPGTDYSGLKIEITDNTGAVCTKKLKSGNTITVQRSMITDITLTASSFVPTKGEAPRYCTTSSEEVNAPWVQLWAGGPKFAVYNVGAESTTEYGGYYTWGGTYKNGEGITWKDDHNNILEGSVSGGVVLSGTDDTATKLWGSKWRMPTKEEFDNLLANCIVGWQNYYNGTGKNGLLCTGKGAYSSNSVFLPAASYCYFGGVDVYGQGCYGYYWSATPSGSNLAFRLRFDSGRQDVGDDSRGGGYSVRAVLNEAK